MWYKKTKGHVHRDTRSVKKPAMQVEIRYKRYVGIPG